MRKINGEKNLLNLQHRIPDGESNLGHLSLIAWFGVHTIILEPGLGTVNSVGQHFKMPIGQIVPGRAMILRRGA